MFGAIIGDIVGSSYEFDVNDIKTKEFPLFSRRSTFTDDSVMTLAVAQAMLDASVRKNDGILRERLIASMQTLGKDYPYAGYGLRFSAWLDMDDPVPYGSYGNGSAMRVSPAAWLFDTIDEVRRAARLSAKVTHNHPDGIKGAEATASAIFLARTGHSKTEIRAYIISEFEYDLSRTWPNLLAELCGIALKCVLFQKISGAERIFAVLGLLIQQSVIQSLHPAAKTGTPAAAEGDLQHEFSQRNAGDHICQYMLAGKQCGEANEDRKDKGKKLIPCRDAALAEYPPKADPAFQTVNGGQQVKRRIRSINEPKQPLRRACTGDRRTDIGTGDHQKYDAADQLGDHFSGHNGVPLIQPGHQHIANCPK